jgi:hypothetical protein
MWDDQPMIPPRERLVLFFIYWLVDVSAVDPRPDAREHEPTAEEMSVLGTGECFWKEKAEGKTNCPPCLSRRSAERRRMLLLN